MLITHENVILLLDYVKIDSYSVICHFKCNETNKSVVSAVPFEPFEGKLEFTYKEVLLHPIKSYNKYYHTPITIYGSSTQETIILKAFKKISRHFVWDAKKEILIHN
ncbi:hypothetical protein [Sulfurimonas sp.]|jgi:hypothetical protein|uniref:hypothetical protein n=1 Tax=Sulfurimonas sp. TaxID=2022749 RepID=UPI0025E7B040|nr:hypothetical protein [Sulfurimonas sp.]MBT5935949.1 hypothetical protein [Sulfurimonas sp.]